MTGEDAGDADPQNDADPRGGNDPRNGADTQSDTDERPPTADGGVDARLAGLDAARLDPAAMASQSSGLDGLSTLLDRPSLARVYVYVCYWEPTTVPETVDALDLSESTAYEYVDRLVDHGLVTRADAGRPRTLRADPVAVVDPVGPVVVTPTVLHAVALAATDEGLARFHDRHGLGTLVATLRGAGLHYAGETTRRSVAADVGVRPTEAMLVIEALAPVLAVGRERDPYFEALFPDVATAMELPDLTDRATVPATDGPVDDGA
ncbi:hypothetical protein [Halobaculum sp. MBLA0143]|uniref:DUF7437 domain-containing protein n=1 Tax=Halobaculum sp. MBLA0143 TaxID=3079933 RepID=UPI003526B3EF